jgi:hypothetical protein
MINCGAGMDPLMLSQNVLLQAELALSLRGRYLHRNSARTRDEPTLSRGNGTCRFVAQEADVASCPDETQLLLFKPYFI